MPDNNEKMQFVPFNAVNEFMRDDFRLDVIRTVYTGLAVLPESHQKTINQLTGKYVKVTGFRNSKKAPAPMKAKACMKVFKNNSHMAAAILFSWSELHSELRQQVHEMLVGRGWDLLREDADRTKLPGFMIDWPQGEDFDKLNDNFAEIYPDHELKQDDISLMVVWLSTKLPYRDDDTIDPEMK